MCRMRPCIRPACGAYQALVEQLRCHAMPSTPPYRTLPRVAGCMSPHTHAARRDLQLHSHPVPRACTSVVARCAPDALIAAMVRRSCTVIAVLAQADTQSSSIGVTWGSADLGPCSLRIGSQEPSARHGPSVLRCPGNAIFRGSRKLKKSETGGRA